MNNLNQILSPLTSLNRVGDFFSKQLEKLVGGNRVFDLLLHRPLRVENIAINPRVFEVEKDSLVILQLKISAHIKPENPRQPFKIQCVTTDGNLVNLVYFKIFPTQLQKTPVGLEVAVLGYLQHSFIGRNLEYQISHPLEILPITEIEKMPRLNVIYPLNAGITQKFLNKKIHDILPKISNQFEEWIDENLVKQNSWPSFYDALCSLHYVGKINNQIARKRLAYDEFLAWQIALILAKKNNATGKKIWIPASAEMAGALYSHPREGGEPGGGSKTLLENFISQLPFKPTDSQVKAVSEINAEINSDKKMLRLLQGDVGSGKTIVAIAACLASISQNKQVCVIVPITILAKQHFSYFSKFLPGLEISLLTSANTKKQKEKILENLASGKTNILIATHAAIEEDVVFKNLGFAVIDEQHRFGVNQRLKLVGKGQDVDVLLMSATPIPRSLMMGLYGDMDISILAEKPKNRQEIETVVMSNKKSDQLHESIKRAVEKGEKIYWICPAIEEMSEEDLEQDHDLKSAKEKYRELVKIFGEEGVSLIHGKMKEKEKEKVMLDFAQSGKILVATTVIEVGIDISDATIIIIENSEHFGLSQLHQLRGRVGRSDKKSFCILLYGKKYGANAKARLGVLRQSNDGFFIAEEDLKMRGSGDLLGTKQSGFPEFKVADLGLDVDLLKIAYKNAEVILSRDPKLEAVGSQKYQGLMRLFEYDDCLRILAGG